jgi:hypothetical protein
MEFNLKNPKRLSQWIVAAICSDITKLANANGENVVRHFPQMQAAANNTEAKPDEISVGLASGLQYLKASQQASGRTT